MGQSFLGLFPRAGHKIMGSDCGADDIAQRDRRNADDH